MAEKNIREYFLLDGVGVRPKPSTLKREVYGPGAVDIPSVLISRMNNPIKSRKNRCILEKRL